MSSRDFSFEKLIEPIACDDFLHDYWEKNYLLVERGDPSYYGSIFSLADVDRWLHIARESPESTVTIVPPPGSEQGMETLRGQRIDTKKALTGFYEGATVRLVSMDRLWHPVASLGVSLREVLNARVNANAYLTPADSQAFRVHFDTHDVFVLQVEGSKDWYVYERCIDAPIQADSCFDYMTAPLDTDVDEDDAKLIRQVRLEKGDLLYLPRGFPHKAVATGEGSLHLTIGVHPLYWVDVLKAALEAVARDNAELRRALPPGLVTDAEVRRGMTQTFRQVLEVAGRRASLERTLDEWIPARLRQQDYPPDGHFAQLAELDKLTPDSLVERRRGLQCWITNGSDSVEICFAQSHIRGPAAAAPAFEHIRDRRRFRVADLPGQLDDDSKLVLVRRLIREGLLKVERLPPTD